MREILFRGKRLDNGEWVYGSFCMDAREQFNGLCGVDGFIRLYDKAKGKMQTYEVDRETVGQYTGLKDKNGKMIWEGDVIEWDYTCNKGKPHQVRYDVGSACFVASREHNGNIIDTVFYNDGQHAEVISNVHDNPELLEK